MQKRSWGGGSHALVDPLCLRLDRRHAWRPKRRDWSFAFNAHPGQSDTLVLFLTEVAGKPPPPERERNIHR